eukprot:gene466-3799_t
MIRIRLYQYVVYTSTSTTERAKKKLHAATASARCTRTQRQRQPDWIGCGDCGKEECMQGKLAMIVSLLVLKWVKVLERTARYLQSSWVAMHMSCGYDASLRLLKRSWANLDFRARVFINKDLIVQLKTDESHENH